MKDYSALSNFEVTRCVALRLGLSVLPFAKAGDCCRVEDDGYTGFVDYCNDPSDAYPIIDENNISIINDHPELRIATSSVNSLMNEIDSDCYFQAANENGLRAAMEVYLMMKDAEKSHG